MQQKHKKGVYNIVSSCISLELLYQKQGLDKNIHQIQILQCLRLTTGTAYRKVN